MAELGLGELGVSRDWPSILGKAVYRGANNGIIGDSSSHSGFGPPLSTSRPVKSTTVFTLLGYLEAF
jgi:hypothetical protein